MASRKESENIFNKDHTSYPMHGRKDCMTLSNITKDRDQIKTNTKTFESTRMISNNNCSADIEGKKFETDNRNITAIILLVRRLTQTFRVN